MCFFLLQVLRYKKLYTLGFSMVSSGLGCPWDNIPRDEPLEREQRRSCGDELKWGFLMYGVLGSPDRLLKGLYNMTCKACCIFELSTPILCDLNRFAGIGVPWMDGS